MNRLHENERSNWVRLRTLVILRWAAIAGQIAALVVARQLLDLRIEIGLTTMAIGASVIANLFSGFLYPETKRLSELEAFLMLMFDLLQLCLLLYLTGGLNNPFALLVLAPVTIASTFLQLRNTAILGVVAIIIVTMLGFWNVPLLDINGYEVAMPVIYRLGFWVAIVVGVVFQGVYARLITSEIHQMADALLATQMALAREQKLTDLGGVVAAAAHELGTPLATIKLVSSEMIDELGDHPELAEDMQLISQQADRCRDILRSMGNTGKDDLHMKRMPLEAIVRDAAEPHSSRGKQIEINVSPETDNPSRQPILERRPEVVHGLRNLIQNAVDFASSSVLIELGWNDKTITLRIEDDGPGYPPNLLGRIGDPFVRRRDEPSRPGYEGMGLGLFIAKTLLERSGASLDFANGGVQGGAIVNVEWSRAAVDPQKGNRIGALGENQPFEA